jgi:hypothetical protein
LSNVSSWYANKKQQWSTSSPKTDPNGSTDEEVAQELKRIQELVSQSKIPPDAKPLDDQYEHIDL